MVQNASLDSPILFRFNLLRGIFFLFYAFFAVAFYFWFITPYLQIGDLFAPRLLADSITYQEICPKVVSLDEWYWLRDAGPCISLHILNQSTGLVTLVNALLIVIPAYLMAKNYKINPGKVLFLLLINPITFFSLFGPNKEVFGIACIMFFLISLKKRSASALVVTLTLALFARLPILAIIVVYLVLIKLINTTKFNTRPRRALFRSSLLLMGLTSIIAIIAGGQVQLDMLGDVLGAEDNSKSTIVSLSMQHYADNGLFFLTYVVRVALNFFGAIPNLGATSFETHGAYYMIGVTGSSVLFLVFSSYLFYRRKRLFMRSNSESFHIFLFFVFTTMMLSLSPVIQHRYFYPLYAIIILAMLSCRGNNPARTFCKYLPANNNNFVSV